MSRYKTSPLIGVNNGVNVGALILSSIFQSYKYKETLENTEGEIKNGQPRESGNIGHTRRRKTNQQHNIS